jgi:beta-glucosidase
MRREDFGKGFVWGSAVSSLQTEGFIQEGGRGKSIWEQFYDEDPKRIQHTHGDPFRACGSYRLYPHDIAMLTGAGFGHYRFSLSWPRIMPSGSKYLNKRGLAYYNVMIDHILARGITPWVTLYHWDLPQALQEKGGWQKRDIIHRLEEFAYVAGRYFGDRVKNWMVLNEPSVFTGAGYLLGIHAPGVRGLDSFLHAAHHAVLAQAAGARVLRETVPDAHIGTTFSWTHFEPLNQASYHRKAADRLDALINRYFLEPALGMGYPDEAARILHRLGHQLAPYDNRLMAFDFDFIGIQAYTRQIAAAAPWLPVIRSRIIPAEKRKVPLTAMQWEDHPEALGKTLLALHRRYPQLPPVYVTENGIGLEEVPGDLNDSRRIAYYSKAIESMHHAMREGANVLGYFAWSLLDNLEWAEGYKPKFGLVQVDFNSLERRPKQSWHWFREFLGCA